MKITEICVTPINDDNAWAAVASRQVDEKWQCRRVADKYCDS